MKANDILAMLEKAEKLAAKNHGLRTSRTDAANGGFGAANQSSAEPAETPLEPRPDAPNFTIPQSENLNAHQARPSSDNGDGVPIGKIDPVKMEVPQSDVGKAPEQATEQATEQVRDKTSEQPAGVAAPVGPDPNAPRDLTASWHDNVPTSHGSIVRKGMLGVFGFLAIFVAWSVLSPISSAVVAAGKVVSTGKNKLVQHPEGGVVSEILVQDGSKVKAGDLLMTLDRSAKQAEFSRLLARQTTLLARQSRYQAEQRGEAIPAAAAVQAPNDDTLSNLRGGQAIVDEAVIKAQQQANPVLEEQRRNFEASRKRLAAQLETITAQIEKFKEQKAGFEARLAGGQRILALTERELSRVRPLADEGYLPKSRLWELEKTQLEQITAGQNLRSEIEANNQRIAEASSKLNEIQEDDREKRSEELTKVIGELAEIRDQVPAAKFALDSTELRAPVDGTIVNLVANTKGGVLPSGTPIAEIVPEGAELQVEFRVPLNKAKQVQVGAAARVSITTFNRRLYDPLDAKVIFVSADSLTDEQTGDSYFLALAQLIDTPNKKTGFDEITSGMAGEVYVVSKPRVFATYVIQPLVDSFNRAFREQ